jgi:hypothetical protein
LDAQPGSWSEQIHAAALEVSADRLYLEQIKLQSSPALPTTAELVARDDFIGDVARTLLENAPDVDRFALAESLDLVRKKLSKLPGADVDSLVPPVSPDEIIDASSLLVSRLLVAHAEDIEAAR